MPIINTGYKREAFLRLVSRYLCGGDPVYGEVEEGGEKVIYFGAGYWRGYWLLDETGVVLVNPGRNRTQALTVEEALCILNCGRFQA